MNTGWETLAEALRDELQEYGGLLNILQDQQRAILHRKPDQVLELNGQIERQLRGTRERRKRREALDRELAQFVQRPADSSLRDLIGFFPDAVRPMLLALIEEVNHLLTRTKRRARQNQMLLARSIEVSQEILQKLNPEGLTKTYSPKGQLKVGATGNGSRCLARG